MRPDGIEQERALPSQTRYPLLVTRLSCHTPASAIVPFPMLQSTADLGIIMGPPRPLTRWRTGSESMAVPVELSRILIRETEDSHIVELKEVEGERYFPIVIGLNEAAAIKRRLMNDEPPRPQTHELLATIIDELGATVDKVIISRFGK